ncbi:MAG TPA: hypothetical protein VNX46_03215, partial [Candidatus Acidoferrum sp.]|nr:hypothetical protein [Candidatus Acidoferrum sp.]
TSTNLDWQSVTGADHLCVVPIIGSVKSVVDSASLGALCLCASVANFVSAPKRNFDFSQGVYCFLRW